ncbi:nucleotidyl transferase AbiEii/AbiGii toxin family protein [Hymenobacter psychrophilus]|uniref:Nucleotidyl transferase AbiEii toxin, Type IV TA system n=1 Tax=Hymenobacter psychrophilus TaxID=651662 RepID=A0A1H3NZA3_9BACT|nr:nucleotidyl transferase AbiEii/AbiGii toxin family protein [Hymenobacter psychrophilus]SDY94206.1 Nucleotidyl transferase AbiEii toxin, Type IV TA system [Hymenobacter psychrophilus]
MDIKIVNKIKRLAVIALASDDELIENIVLKGGNAIDLAYSDGCISRTSYDLDFSIANGDFLGDIDVIKDRIRDTLAKTYKENGFILIDYEFIIKPKTAKIGAPDFWGGYLVQFKVVEESVFDKYENDKSMQRRLSIAVKPNNSPKFEIEFSKFEFIKDKKSINVDGYTVYVYTPEMIVFEKVRAICQQLPQYSDIVKSETQSARARDFYDIYLIMTTCGVEIESEESIDLLKNIFEAKGVPLEYINEIRSNKSIHSDDWENVKATISQVESPQEFSFYFDYVVNTFEKITGL